MTRIVIVSTEADYREIKKRVAAAALLMDGEVFLDLESGGGEVPYSATAEYVRRIRERHEARAKTSRSKPPPAYLKHDPTKRHVGVR